MFQVMQGVKYLHEFSAEESIGHFDIKPDNVMVNSKGILMLADFGTVLTLEQRIALEECYWDSRCFWG
jgi:serine/threonine protein kinase